MPTVQIEMTPPRRRILLAACVRGGTVCGGRNMAAVDALASAGLVIAKWAHEPPLWMKLPGGCQHRWRGVVKATKQGRALARKIRRKP